MERLYQLPGSASAVASSKSGSNGLSSTFSDTMRQAIEEGFILDVLQSYTTYGTYFELLENEKAPQGSIPLISGCSV